MSTWVAKIKQRSIRAKLTMSWSDPWHVIPVIQLKRSVCVACFSCLLRAGTLATLWRLRLLLLVLPLEDGPMEELAELQVKVGECLRSQKQWLSCKMLNHYNDWVFHFRKKLVWRSSLRTGSTAYCFAIQFLRWEHQSRGEEQRSERGLDDEVTLNTFFKAWPWLCYSNMPKVSQNSFDNVINGVTTLCQLFDMWIQLYRLNKCMEASNVSDLKIDMQCCNEVMQPFEKSSHFIQYKYVLNVSDCVKQTFAEALLQVLEEVVPICRKRGGYEAAIELLCGLWFRPKSPESEVTFTSKEFRPLACLNSFGLWSCELCLVCFLSQRLFVAAIKSFRSCVTQDVLMNAININKQCLKISVSPPPRILCNLS